MQNEEASVRQEYIEFHEQLWLCETVATQERKAKKQVARGCWQCQASQDC